MRSYEEVYKENVEKLWSGWAAGFKEWFMRISHKPHTKKAIRWLEIPPDCRILDVGCGSGWAIYKMSRYAVKGRLMGIDISLAMVAKANSSYGEPNRVTFLHGDAEQIPLEDNSFDLVVSFESVFFWPDLSKALIEIHRVLASDGRIVIFTGIYEGMKFQRFKLRISRFFVGNIAVLVRKSQKYKAVFTDAGFSEVSHKMLAGALCIFGTKSVGAPNR
jgi:ubiquinone/menaquinone biosynthesis C-methylase UbiE